MKIRWLEAAAEDVNQLHAFIERDKPAPADEEVSRVLDAVGRLGEHTALGGPGRVAGTRELVVSSYIVAYRVKGVFAQVLRVLHAARQWPVD